MKEVINEQKDVETMWIIYANDVAWRIRPLWMLNGKRPTSPLVNNRWCGLSRWVKSSGCMNPQSLREFIMTESLLVRNWCFKKLDHADIEIPDYS
jgi:hypothetical protein